MVVKIGSVPRETLPNRPPKDIRKQRTKRYKTTGYRSKIPARPPLEKFSCTRTGDFFYEQTADILRWPGFVWITINTYSLMRFIWL